MMKKTWPILNLIVWALILCPEDLPATQVILRTDGPSDSMLEQKMQHAVQQQWLQWAEKYHRSTAGDVIKINIRPAGELQERWAQTVRDEIILSSQIPQEIFFPVLKHELSHLFLLKSCGAHLPSRHQLLHETFAQWFSKDFNRLILNTPFGYAKQARVWFELHGWNAQKNSKTFELALARLLSIIDVSVLDKFYDKLLSKCQNPAFVASDWENNLALILKLTPVQLSTTKPLDYLLIDGHSQQILKREGKIDTLFPPGSILKPILVGIYPQLITEKYSRDNVYWACPEVKNTKNPRLWSWKEALSKSCNGFFLDEKIESWNDLNQLFSRTKISSSIVSMPQAIGLTPGVKLSLSQALQLYYWLTFTAPSILDALRDTPDSGTLALNPSSSWFYSHKISLKSGTQRDIKSRPEHAWIIAVGPRLENNRPSFLAAIHAEGASTRYLIYELHQRLKNLSRNNYTAKIQLLNLVPQNKISLSCNEHRPMMIKLDQHWLWNRSSSVEEGGFKNGAQYLCLGGALELSFPRKDNQQEQRKYYGVLEFQQKNTARGMMPNFEMPIRENQAKARESSPFILHTSERYYLWGVLAAEFPRGHKELLKSLALVARNNLRYYHSENRNICDNTWCQVFGPGQDLPPRLNSKLVQAVEEIYEHRLSFNEGKRWLYFSLGGQKIWQKDLRSQDLERELGINGINNLSLIDNQVSIRSDSNVEKQIPCELFRNQLRLLSCPAKMIRTEHGRRWHFTGQGEGHSLGLNLMKANTLSAQGKTANEILTFFYPGVQITTGTEGHQ